MDDYYMMLLHVCFSFRFRQLLHIVALLSVVRLLVSYFTQFSPSSYSALFTLSVFQVDTRFHFFLNNGLVLTPVFPAHRDRFNC